MKFYEIMLGNEYAICIKADKESSKTEVYEYLKEHEENAKRFEFSVDDISINEITEQEAYNLYNMEYINTLPILR